MNDAHHTSHASRYTPHASLLLVGLGNPGNKYQNNRHNVGFMFVDFLLKEYVSRYAPHATRFLYNKYVKSEVAQSTLHDSRYTPHATRLTPHVVLAKPQTFMNKSGDAVAKLIKNYELQIMNSNQNTSSSLTSHASRYAPHALRYTLCVIHDDLDLRLGNFKIQKGVGPKVHNGIESIEKALGTKDFYRVRIGIDNRTPGSHIPGEPYVLSDFSVDEKKMLDHTFPKIQERLMEFLVNTDKSTA